jgi:hypothetical protein
MNAAQKLTVILRRRARYRLIHSTARQLLRAVQLATIASIVYALLVLSLAL